MEKALVLNTFGTFVVIGQIVIGLLFGFQLFSKHKLVKKILHEISENRVGILFLISITAMLGSLTFSEILHFTPCKLCWYQRSFMYPQAIILGIAFWKKDSNIVKYVVALSVVGLLIALYHVLLQNYPGLLPCSDEIVNCAKVKSRIFGYITIPVMSATAFLLLIVVGIIGKKKK